jgi:hypothetical protein
VFGFLSGYIYSLFDERTNMNAVIAHILTGEVDSPFDSYYGSAKALFASKGRFQTLSETTCERLPWPGDNGVYIVWQTSPSAEVLYIGMTGKFSQAGTMSGPGLKARKARWTPYRFDETANAFCFGPKYAKGENRMKGPPKAGYSRSIPISNIRIDCFEYDTTNRMAPAFLESLLLQGI